MKRIDKLVILGLCLFLPLFLYNLGSYSLVDFDEGWYAEIARNILNNFQPLYLSFNDKIFFDHPPLGFILMALSFFFFGINEFAARFPSAILGFSTVIILYLLGKNLFNRAIGLGASLVLLSSVWFLFRARSGNLDTVFLFFYVLSFYFAVRMTTNPRWVLGLALSLSAVLLTKSVIGITIVIPIIVLLILKRVRVPLRLWLLALVLFVVIFLPWYLANYLVFGPWFLNSNLSLGLRSDSRTLPNFFEIWHSNTLQYLHSGIGKWFYPAVLSLVFSLFWIRREKKLIPIILVVVILLFGFLSNTGTEIWHLIPLYPFLALLISFTFFKALRKFPLLFVGSFLALALFQIYQFRNGINLFSVQTSGLAHSATAARRFSGRLYLDASDFFPSAVFYSRRHVDFMRSLTYPQNILSGMIVSGPKPFLLLTEQWRLDTDKIPQESYQVLDNYNGSVLIAVPKQT